MSQAGLTLLYCHPASSILSFLSADLAVCWLQCVPAHCITQKGDKKIPPKNLSPPPPFNFSLQEGKGESQTCLVCKGACTGMHCLIECSAEVGDALGLCLCSGVWKWETLTQWILTFSSRSVCVHVCVRACVCLCGCVSVFLWDISARQCRQTSVSADCRWERVFTDTGSISYTCSSTSLLFGTLSLRMLSWTVSGQPLWWDIEVPHLPDALILYN